MITQNQLRKELMLSMIKQGFFSFKEYESAIKEIDEKYKNEPFVGIIFKKILHKQLCTHLDTILGESEQ